MIPLAIFACLTTLPIAAFDYRENSPSSLFPYNQAAIDATLPDGTSNPAYAPLIRYPYLHFSGSKPYTLDEIYSTLLKIGYGTGVLGCQASWNRFGFDQYLENIVEAGFGFRPVHYVSFGAGICYYNISIHTPEVSLSSHLFDGSISVLAAPFEWIDLSARLENIGSVFIKKRKDLLYPGWSAGVALKPVRGLSLRWNINRTEYGYINSISATVNILKYLSVGAGYARETETGSAAISLIYKYVALSYGLKYHPHLGFTHSVGVTLALQEMPVEALNYGRMFARIHGDPDIPKIDVSTCTLEELMQIPEINETFAERIIKYRNAVGPVTKGALVRIGMKESEVAHLLKYVGRLPEDNAGPKGGRRTREEFEKARKNIFTQLLKEGLSASVSLEISGMAVKGERRIILQKVSALPGIDAGKKKRILELCAGPF
ncbi:MAG: hypothetical protein A2W19_10695 [Spirochaetes bacterium RBG_16_49_21]|nr:MAG: hypothetical protein A2W19_10695 [Spirochaetes bacterium RBG_16_49_21]